MVKDWHLIAKKEKHLHIPDWHLIIDFKMRTETKTASEKGSNSLSLPRLGVYNGVLQLDEAYESPDPNTI